MKGFGYAGRPGSARPAGRVMQSVAALLCFAAVSFATGGPDALAQPGKDVVVWNAGIGPGWNDYGWAPRVLTAGNPAQIDMGKWNGWIVAAPELAAGGGLDGPFSAVRVKFKAPSLDGDFMEVRLSDDADVKLPTLRVGFPAAGSDGYRTATIPYPKLNPAGARFDRIIFRPFRELAAASLVQFDDIRFVAGAAPSGSGSGSRSGSGSGSGVTAPKSASTVKGAAPSRGARLAIDCAADKRPIDADIYGIGFNAVADDRSPQQWQMGATTRRWGGNPTSRYNWELGNAWNTAQDYFWRNVTIRNSGTDPAWKQFMDANRVHSVSSALSVPMLGWVAKDTTSYSFSVAESGPQQATDPFLPDAGNGNRPDGKPVPVRSGLEDRTSVRSTPESIGRWVKTITQTMPAGSVSQYILDNEPDLWHGTHRDVHPVPATYDEILEKSIAYATAIRAADPKAEIAGPASWGWWGYFYSARDEQAGFGNKPDRKAHGDVPFLEWYLREMRAAEQRTGVKLLDVLDVHLYPQARGMFGGLEDVSNAGGALRIRSTRALWDPTYRDESWINEKIALLPRMRSWVDANAPGVGLSIGEWNFGGENHISGGLATAIALGQFGRYGVNSAYYWTIPPADSPVFWAFRAFRNFDGQGGRFLDTSVRATTVPNVSFFASTDATGEVVAIAVNESSAAAVTTSASRSNCAAATAFRTYTYDTRGKTIRPAVAVAATDSQTVTLPPWSITVLRWTK